MAYDDRTGGGRRPDAREPRRGAERGGMGREAHRPHRLGDHSAHDEEDRLPDRYGGSVEDGYGSGGGFGPTSADPNSIHSAPGHDAGFGGPRFDRADAGSTGTHGVHPVASPSGGAYQGYGATASGYASSARSAAIIEQARQQESRGGSREHDPHYSEWRRRQIEQLDREYEDYCRERQSRFEEDFGAWREQRGRQRSTLGQVREQMKVVGSDGEHVGTVDKVAGDRIILTRNDPAAGGMHHSLPCGWIDAVGDEVRLNRAAEDAMREWRSEEESGALFERGGPGAEARSRDVSRSDR